MPDRREVFAAKGPKDDFGSCIVEYDFEPRGVLDPFTRNQARLIVDAQLPCFAKLRAESLCERLQQFLFKLSACSFFILAPWSAIALRGNRLGELRAFVEVGLSLRDLCRFMLSALPGRRVPRRYVGLVVVVCVLQG